MKTWRGWAGLLLICVASSSFAGPIVVGSGAGSAEFYAFFAQKSAEATFTICLKDSSCGSSLQSVLTTILKQKPFSSAIRVVKGSVVGAVDFKTDSHAGADILLNQDRLWVSDGADLRAMNYQEVFLVLTRAWSAQLNLPAEVVQELTLHLTPLLQAHWTETPWWGDIHSRLGMVQFDSDADLVFLVDSSNFAGAFSRELKLSSTFDCDSSVGSKFAPQVVSARAFRWTARAKSGSEELLSALGSVEYFCGATRLRAELILYIPIEPTGAGYTFSNKDVRGVLQNISFRAD